MHISFGIVQADHRISDDSNQTGQINGKTCKMIESSDETVKNLANRRSDSIFASFKNFVDRITSYCQTKLSASLFLSCFQPADNDKQIPTDITYGDGKQTPTETIDSLKKLSNLMSPDYIKSHGKETLHQEIIAEAMAFNKAVDLETENYSPLYVATESLTLDQKSDFVNYFKYDIDGKEFRKDNFEKTEYQNLQTIMNLFKQQIKQDAANSLTLT